jgi:hypothetical protein
MKEKSKKERKRKIFMGEGSYVRERLKRNVF